MKLLDKIKMSHWAYNQCKSGNDTPEMRKLITDSIWVYMYCKYIKENKRMLKKMDMYDYSIYMMECHVKKSCSHKGKRE